MPISTRRWRAISAAAAPMCASARRSSAPRTARHREAAMNLHKTHSHALSNFGPLPSRRALVTGALAGGFVLAFRMPLKAANEPEQPPDNPASQFAPNAFIRIDHAGKTTLVMPQVEMGQGVYTAVAMILADELDADFAAVTLEHAPPNDKLYGNPIIIGLQATGNSNSIRAFWKPLRVAG